MTNAVVESLVSEPVSMQPVPLGPAADALPAREHESSLHGFLKHCDLHAHPGEPARKRCRRMARVLQPEPGALPEAALEVLREIAVVAEIAVEARLRALLAPSPPIPPQLLTWPLPVASEAPTNPLASVPMENP